MKKLLVILTGMILFLMSCDPTGQKVSDLTELTREMGTINFNFTCKTVLPENRVIKTGLQLAYNSDSLDRGLFYTSINVSDVVSKYQLLLPEGTYYYKAGLMCLCGGDSCLSAGFTGQYGINYTGGKIVSIKNQVTNISVQFH